MLGEKLTLTETPCIRVYYGTKHMMHSPEVELTEIFVSNIFNGNGLAPSDKPPDTKNTTRGVHNFRILKIL